MPRERPGPRPELAARLPALPALARQLLDTADEAAKAIELIGARFARIAARARAVAGPVDAELLDDLATAAIALQFQDAMSQRLHHVVAALGELHEELGARLEGRAPEGPGDWEARLRASFTMARERDVLAAAGPACGPIELF